MVAVRAAGDPELGLGEVESPEVLASVISDLIGQGASLQPQTDVTGETALHLAARFCRSDAAKCMLDMGADTNAQDRSGRTPLHTAVAADAQGVFQVPSRHGQRTRNLHPVNIPQCTNLQPIPPNPTMTSATPRAGQTPIKPLSAPRILHGAH
ncbi:hypothetical protein chiPu_0031812 [Chiloscyllium punctatum]|uniref:Uncharacterized protein n=1 Tax=Chiloscyllium punctatum TaxID=137246 RepID=A0A401TXY7_CHIPU|nr:hypothetical protein [Chiloscyllium punctatum]